MLSICNLSDFVADKPVLKGFTLDVPSGAAPAIMGPSGDNR